MRDEHNMREDSTVVIDGEIVRGPINNIDFGQTIDPLGENTIFQLAIERINDNYCNIEISNVLNEEVLAFKKHIKIDQIWAQLMNKRKELYPILLDLYGDDPLPQWGKLKILEIIKEAAIDWERRPYGHNENPDYEEESDERVFPEEIMLEAEKILSSKKPIDGVKKHLDNMIAGEDSNKLFVFILSLTAKCKDPSKKIIICAKQEAGAGKSWLLENVSSFFKCHVVSHLTKKALNYMGEQLANYEMLYIKELGLLDKENDTTGNSSLKMMSVDDGGLSTTYTYKDPDSGKFTTETIKTDPKTILTSTTRKDIDPQFVRRYWIFSPDGSVEQTSRIEAFKIRKNNQENDVILGIRKFTDYDYSKEFLTCVVSLIEDRDILIPFYETIYGMLDKSKLRIRSDYDKIKLLLEMYALLNIRNLPTIKMNNKTIFLLTPELAIEAMQIAREPLIYMAKDVEGRDYELVEIFRKLKLSPTTEDDVGTRIDYKVQLQIAELLGNKSRMTIIRWLNDFEQKGFVVEVNHRPIVYELTKTVEEMEYEMSGYATLSDKKMLIEVLGKMRFEANEYFEKRGIDFRFSDGNSYENPKIYIKEK